MATYSRGLEGVVARELEALGAGGVRPGRGMVRFRGPRETMIRCCMALRAASRVLVPLAEGAAQGKEALYALASTVPWEELVPRGATVGVEVAGTGGGFTNTRYAAQVLKDAVVDRIRARRGWRPAVDRRRPDVPIHLHLGRDGLTVALDAAGTPLGRRGYRTKGGPAALNPALTAGLLLLADYDGSRPLLDPMTGTGTFAIEAALIATGTPPGLHRRFAFERWPGYDPRRTEAVRSELRAGMRPAPAPILATDHDPRAVRAARENAGRAGVGDAVAIAQGEATALECPGTDGIIVINPPYGHRIGETEALGVLYQALGDRLKTAAQGCTAWILAGNRELAKRIGLRASRRLVVFNGPIECRWLRFDLYAGSRKVGRDPISGRAEP